MKIGVATLGYAAAWKNALTGKLMGRMCDTHHIEAVADFGKGFGGVNGQIKFIQVHQNERELKKNICFTVKNEFFKLTF